MFVYGIFWAITGKSDIVAFLDGGSLAIAVVGPVALLYASFGWKGVRDAFSTLFAGSSQTLSVQHASGFFRIAATYSLACGFGGLLIGLMIMLQNMADPAMIGPATACALLSQFYAVLLATLSIVAASIFTSRLAPELASKETFRNGSHALARLAPAAALGVLAVLLCFVVIMASFA